MDDELGRRESLMRLSSDQRSNASCASIGVQASAQPLQFHFDTHKYTVVVANKDKSRLFKVSYS